VDVAQRPGAVGRVDGELLEERSDDLRVALDGGRGREQAGEVARLVLAERRDFLGEGIGGAGTVRTEKR